MEIRLTHTLHDLDGDIRGHAREVGREGARAVRDVAKDGNKMARRLARRSAGSHGKHYFKAITAERLGRFEWEWGPDSAMPQGGMSFERGSRNQPPHHDLAQSADKHGAPELARRLDETLGRILS